MLAAMASASPSPLVDVALQQAIEAYKESYRDFADNWRAMETKAQGSVAIAGLFVAGVFALVRDKAPGMPPFERVVLGATIVSLLLTIYWAIRVLAVRDVEGPVRGETLQKVAEDFQVLPVDERNRYRQPYQVSVCLLWKERLQELAKEGSSKAEQLYRAQFCLTVAVALAGILTLYQLFAGGSPSQVAP
jgi:hypothetical protein